MRFGTLWPPFVAYILCLTFTSTLSYELAPTDGNETRPMDDDDICFCPPKRKSGLLLDQTEHSLRMGYDVSERPRYRLRVSRGKAGKKRRSLVDRPWRKQPSMITVAHSAPRPIDPIFPAMPSACPSAVDAVTTAHNKKTYVFAADRVYQTYYDVNGLQQKSVYDISTLFPGGPWRVSAAVTNNRTGITVLIDHRTAYRFRWNRKAKRFYLTRNSPKHLEAKVDFVPNFAFQWALGQIIIASDRGRFATYDPYQGISQMVGSMSDYFWDVPRDTIGQLRRDDTTILWLTRRNQLQVYDIGKRKVVQQFPINISEYIACLKNKS